MRHIAGLSRGRRTTVEAIVLGRNDDYEPNWTGKLKASLTYNRQLFEATGIDYRVVFVEWNPPRGKELLAPGLVSSFPFVRALICDAELHDKLCESSDLEMMLNFPINAAIRSSTADFLYVTGGDVFLSRKVAARMLDPGLRARTLYRAERVNIRPDLDFATAPADLLESPDVIESVNTCSEPPFDKPPYLHACGDFLLMDRASLTGIRGFDESITFARLHLDSRFCRTAMAAGLDCELLGRILHINHSKSYTNNLNTYPGRSYSYDQNLPYLNGIDWGLAGFEWRRLGERLHRIGFPANRRTEGKVPESLTPDLIEAANAIICAIIRVRDGQCPKQPHADVPTEGTLLLPLSRFQTEPHWQGASVTTTANSVAITTSASPWAYSAAMRFTPDRRGADHWLWIELSAHVTQGTVGVGLLYGDEYVGEQIVWPAHHAARVWIPLNRDGEGVLLVRNADCASASIVEIDDVKIVRQYKQATLVEKFLIRRESLGVDLTQ